MALTPKWGIYFDDPGQLALGNTQDATQANSIDAALDAVAHEVSWQRPVPDIADLNELITPGGHPILDTSIANIPTRAYGTAVVNKAGNALTQTYITVQRVPQVYIRRGDAVTKEWQEWSRQDPAVTHAVPLTSRDAGSGLSSLPVHYEVRSASVATSLGMPTDTTGLLIQRNIGTITSQQWIATEGDVSIWVRSSRTDVNSAEWVRIGPSVDISSASGMKIVPLAFSLPAAPATMAYTSGSARWVRSYAHTPGRVRVHISNRNPGSQDSGGSVNLLGVKIGPADSSGTISNPILVASEASLPSDGSEFTSQWVDYPRNGGGTIGLTIGWNGGGLLQRLDSGGWLKSSSDGWDSDDTDGWDKVTHMPFYVWVEAEFPARIPVVVGLGDSITVGRACTNPVEDSWLAAYCRERNALPLFLAQSGSSMIHWVSSDKRWKSYYPGVTLRADAVVNFLGQNNLIPGETLENMKLRFGRIVSAINASFPGVPLYLGGITPSSAKGSDVGDVRHYYNLWLKTLPGGARGYFDFPSAVSDESGVALNAAMAGDSLHPNTAGHVAMARVVLLDPITPATLTDENILSIMLSLRAPNGPLPVGGSPDGQPARDMLALAQLQAELEALRAQFRALERTVTSATASDTVGVAVSDNGDGTVAIG